MKLGIKDYSLIKTDSRHLQVGDIFLPIKGSNFDGHNYIVEAFQKGVKLAYSEVDPVNLGFSTEAIEKYSKQIIRVQNTLDTYHKLANEYRKLVNPIVIGITGSAGKTTAKEILRLVLAEKYKTHYTEANFNNEIGVPQTILSMPVDTQVLVVEMGMRGLGQIELLSKISEPNIAFITNIGTAHIEILGSQDNIRKAKLEILKGLKNYDAKLKSTLVVDPNLYGYLEKANFVDPNTNERISAEKITRLEERSSRVPTGFQGLISEGIITDLNAAYQIAKLLGLNEKEILTGFSKYSPGKGRGQFVYDKAANLFIDETYNSNPEAVRNSVVAMLKQFPDLHKYAVLGDLKESEESLVTELFTEIKNYEAENKFKLVDVRGLEIETIKKQIEELKSLNPGKNVFLLKASRAVGLERVLGKG